MSRRSSLGTALGGSRALFVVRLTVQRNGATENQGRSVGSRAPIAILDQAIEAHPAVVAWNRLPGPHPETATVEVWREAPGNQPASVYRLAFRDETLAAVFGKRCAPRDGAVERRCLEQILPRLRVTSPHYFGSVEEPDGSRWLFLEDVGRQWLEPRHGPAAARWLGRVHRRAARIRAAAELPSAGPERYWAHLRSAHERIVRNRANPALTTADTHVLEQVVALLERIANRWDRIERACADYPVTLVHGDFQPKNIRIRRNGHGDEVHALDWEMAGWGIPAVDLAPQTGIDLARPREMEAYASEVKVEWPHLDAAAIRRLSQLGVILRRLAGMDWETSHLHFEHPDFLLAPVSSLESMHGSLRRGLEAAGPWLR